MKQVIVVRKDLKMDPGKLAAQCGHASVEAVLKSSKKNIEEWKNQGAKKVIVKIDSKEELLDLQKKAKSLKLVTALIKDAGRTFFKKPTITCLGIGPDKEEKIDKVTGYLKML
ncbi:MAG: peptidyl-tRNA hydrolase [Candidatus Aenigmarchaeota archaeon]|nr:peptidyl-tRNA hydrolase [Candidatus Aenigmarchaeota archaeon]